MRNRNLPGGDIGNHGRNEQRGNPLAGRVLDHLGRFTVLGGKTTDSRTHVNAQAERVDIGIFALRLQAGIVHGLVGRGHTVLGEKVLFADKRFVHPILLRVKILDFTGDTNRQALCREIIDILDSANTGYKVFPKGIDIISKGGDDAHTGNHYSFIHVLILI